VRDQQLLTVERKKKTACYEMLYAACMGEMRNAYNILVEKPEGKRPLGIPIHRWGDNIRMYLQEIRWDGVELLQLAQDGTSGLL